jgi:hypothetical protein
MKDQRLDHDVIYDVSIYVMLNYKINILAHLIYSVPFHFEFVQGFEGFLISVRWKVIDMWAAVHLEARP